MVLSAPSHTGAGSQTAAQLKHGDLPQIWADVITKNITVRLGNLEVVDRGNYEHVSMHIEH